jgi:hypothetical protein
MNKKDFIVYGILSIPGILFLYYCVLPNPLQAWYFILGIGNQPMVYFIIALIIFDVWYSDRVEERERIKKNRMAKRKTNEETIKNLKCALGLQKGYTKVAVQRNLKLIGILMFIRESMCPDCYEALGEYVKDIEKLKVPQSLIDEA